MIRRQARQETRLIDGPAGTIELLVEHPAGVPADHIAVVCHPHPLYGGTMRNKVVHTLGHAALDLGATSIRFNFRGVGASGGCHADGEGEAEDAACVADWASREFGAGALWVLGFSFGAWVALRLAALRAAQRLVTVAPPVQRYAFSGCALPQCPWLLIQGEADELVDARVVQDWARGLQRPPDLLLLPGVGHFFHGQLTVLRAAVRDWLQRSAADAAT